MKTSRKIIAAAMVSVVGFVSPSFADATLHVFLWDAMADMDMVDNHKISDNPDRLADVMGVAVNATVVPAGKVTFNVLNVSTDTEHEMVVTKLSGPDGTLPYVADAMRVDEEAAGSKGEVSELPPGEKGSLTVTLDPGTYVLYCNIEGHFAAGMWTVITVK